MVVCMPPNCVKFSCYSGTLWLQSWSGQSCTIVVKYNSNPSSLVMLKEYISLVKLSYNTPRMGWLKLYLVVLVMTF